MLNTKILAATAGLAFASAALAQVNDPCAGAIAISAGSSTAFDTTLSTNDGSSSCGIGQNDIWYTYTATATGVLTASCCGSSYDSVLSMIVGGCGGTEISCNDDFCTGLSSTTSALVHFGDVIMIRVAGFNGARGTGTLVLDLAPQANDACAGAITVTSGSNTAFDTRGTTTDGPSGACGFNNGNDLWYKFVAVQDGTITASCCDADYDSVLTTFDGCGGTELSCNDDFCGTFGLQSTTTASVLAGSTTYIRVAGFNGLSGTGTLSVSFSATGGGCIYVESGAGNLPGTAEVPAGSGSLCSISGNISNGEPADMYKITICDAANFSADTTNVVTGTQDTQLFLFDANGNGVQMNDDATGLQSGMQNQFVSATGTYYIAVSHYDNDPTNAAAAEIWNDTPFAAVRAPDGTLNGGDITIAGWVGGNITAFPYQIDLTGACFFEAGCAADFNGDTVVDFFDYLDFVDAFSANAPSADFNNDTVIDFFDYLDFVDAFSAGC